MSEDKEQDQTGRGPEVMSDDGLQTPMCYNNLCKANKTECTANILKKKSNFQLKTVKIWK